MNHRGNHPALTGANTTPLGSRSCSAPANNGGSRSSAYDRNYRSVSCDKGGNIGSHACKQIWVPIGSYSIPIPSIRPNNEQIQPTNQSDFRLDDVSINANIFCCSNCLAPGHLIKDCISQVRCRICYSYGHISYNCFSKKRKKSVYRRKDRGDGFYIISGS